MSHTPKALNPRFPKLWYASTSANPPAWIPGPIALASLRVYDSSLRISLTWAQSAPPFPASIQMWLRILSGPQTNWDLSRYPGSIHLQPPG